MRTREEIDNEIDVIYNEGRENFYAENKALLLVAEALFDIRDLLTSKKPE